MITTEIHEDLYRIFKNDKTISEVTLKTVGRLVDKLHLTATTNNLWWYPPSISKSNIDDAVVLDWWNKGKRYSLYVLDEKIDYYAQWGVTENNWVGQTESGDINIENTLFNFWSWIGSDTN